MREIDRYSYELGVMDCFCEMVASGMKTLAMSHPCRDREEFRSYKPAAMMKRSGRRSPSAWAIFCPTRTRGSVGTSGVPEKWADKVWTFFLLCSTLDT